MAFFHLTSAHSITFLFVFPHLARRCRETDVVTDVCVYVRES